MKHLPKQYYECTSKRADGNEVPWDRGDSRVFVIPETRLSRDPNFRGLIFQAATIGGLVAIDAAPVLLDPEGGTISYEDFSDLSKLVSAYGDDPVPVQNSGLVQPEVQAWIRVDAAGPGGHLAISLGAKPSLFQPQGMKWQKLNCELKSNPR